MWNGNTLIDSKRNNSDIRTYRAEATLYTSFTPTQDLQVKAYLFDSERGLPGGVIYDNPYAAERLLIKTISGSSGMKTVFLTDLSYRLWVSLITVGTGIIMMRPQV